MKIDIPIFNIQRIGNLGNLSNINRLLCITFNYTSDVITILKSNQNCKLSINIKMFE